MKITIKQEKTKSKSNQALFSLYIEKDLGHGPFTTRVIEDEVINADSLYNIYTMLFDSDNIRIVEVHHCGSVDFRYKGIFHEIERPFSKEKGSYLKQLIKSSKEDVKFLKEDILSLKKLIEEKIENEKNTVEFFLDKIVIK